MKPKVFWIFFFSWFSPLFHFNFKVMLLYCSKAFGEEMNKSNVKSVEVPESLLYQYYYQYHLKIKANDIPSDSEIKNIVHKEMKEHYDICKKIEMPEENAYPEDDKLTVTDSLYRKSIEMLDQVEQSGAKVLEKLGGVMNQMVQSKDQMLKSLDNVMDKVSESMQESKERVIKGFDSVMDKMSESKSKMMEEIDHVWDNLAHCKVLEDIRALPREIKESFVLSVRNKSYIAAGVMVAMTTAVLIAGVLYYAWCHQDTWNYHIVPVEEVSHAADNVLKHVGTTFADGSVVSGGITSCFVRASSQVFTRQSKVVEGEEQS